MLLYMSSKHVNRIFSMLILNKHFWIGNFPIFINSSTINARIFFFLSGLQPTSFSFELLFKITIPNFIKIWNIY